jgi:hypothetical protein
MALRQQQPVVASGVDGVPDVIDRLLIRCLAGESIFAPAFYKNLISRWEPTTVTITIMMMMLMAITMATMEMVIGMVDDGSGSCKF